MSYKELKDFFKNDEVANIQGDKVSLLTWDSKPYLELYDNRLIVYMGEEFLDDLKVLSNKINDYDLGEHYLFHFQENNGEYFDSKHSIKRTLDTLEFLDLSIPKEQIFTAILDQVDYMVELRE